MNSIKQVYKKPDEKSSYAYGAMMDIRQNKARKKINLRRKLSALLSSKFFVQF